MDIWLWIATAVLVIVVVAALVLAATSRGRSERELIRRGEQGHEVRNRGVEGELQAGEQAAQAGRGRYTRDDPDDPGNRPVSST